MERTKLCGLSGHIGVVEKNKKLLLTIGLASGIDERGGDASGYLSISKEGLRYARRRGEWGAANIRFFKSAAMGDLCMMHARYATCGRDAVEDAHPFAIKRNDKVVLWGAHNGVIYDAWDSAKKYGRNITVDSQEIFELIADRNYQGIRDMSGYGVITWVSSNDPHHVKLCRLSSTSEICVVTLKSGGIVWGSTWKIVSKALELAGLEAECNYDLDKIGQVYEIHKDAIYIGDDSGLTVESYHNPMWGSRLGNYLSTYRGKNSFSDEYEKELEALYERWMDPEELEEELKCEGV